MKDVTTVGVSSIYPVSTVSSLGEICGDQVYLIWECGGVADRGQRAGTGADVETGGQSNYWASAALTSILW